ncbi:MAG: NADPH-dependent glutamate synthase [Candidatus Altiarchaeota archaeon]
MPPSKLKNPMPEQPPKKRNKNFEEVALGYGEEVAILEAKRCIECGKCKPGCPVEIDISGFIHAVKEGDFLLAAAIIWDKNNLPAICGRVCPQETQCEKLCVLSKTGEPVAIGRLERFVADYALKNIKREAVKAKSTGKKVAVVGSGPAGLTAAGDLAKLGHNVTIFEALHKPGGVLAYGIPEFRLPKKILNAEIDYLRQVGVKIITDAPIGNTKSVTQLKKEGFDAIFLGTGAGLPYFLGVPGESLPGVYSANEFLIRVNLMKAYLFPEYDTPLNIGERVAVIGGGNVAMDSARCALRMGAKSVSLVYRRTEAEMPARNEEIEHAKEEGIEFRMLTNPIEFLADSNGNLTSMKCLKSKLGPSDESGRRSPILIRGSEFCFPVDTVVIAIGQGPNPLIPETTPEIRVGRKGNIIADENQKTLMEAVWAGGDVVTGAATVIEAMGSGKKAAKSIHEYLLKK